MATTMQLIDLWNLRMPEYIVTATDHCLPPPSIIPIGIGHNRPPVCAAKLADEIMSRIERDGAIHRDSLIDVAVMCGAVAPKTDTAA